MHRSQAAIDEAALDELAKHLDDAGFEGRGHGQVRVLPITENAETLKLLALDLEELLRVLAAAPADVELAHVANLAAEVFQDLMLDGHTVAVPPRYVRSVVAGHELRLHDDVFDDLIEGGAEVNVAVGVRRPVVQDVARLAGVGAAQLVVEIELLPVIENERLPLRQIAAHRKVGLRQVQRVFIVHGRCRGAGS